jgi:hypothetical protein
MLRVTQFVIGSEQSSSWLLRLRDAIERWLGERLES